MLGGDNNLIRVKLFLIGAVLLASLSDLSAQTSTSDPPRVAGTPALDIELQLQSFD